MRDVGRPPSPTDWIARRLVSPRDNIVTSWVPAGFAAYARVLHEVDGYDSASPVVRWGDVAKWSATALGPDTQWIDIALPETLPSEPPPWRNQGPREGWLSRVDTAALAAVLDPSERARCFFGVWSGYGLSIDVSASPSNISPLPARFSSQPTFELPSREFPALRRSVGGGAVVRRGRGAVPGGQRLVGRRPHLVRGQRD